MKKTLIFAFISFAMIYFLASCANLNRMDRSQNPRGTKSTRPRGGGSGGSVFENNPRIPANFEGKITKGVAYASNTNYLGQKQDLRLDILEPNRGSAGKFPLFVYIHGGGFLVGGRSGAGGFRAGLANNGFVVASIDYRLGWSRAGNRIGCSGDSLDLKYAIYRALQDLNASLRFLVANAEKYRIDTNWIFVGGQSAGGVTSLNASFLSQEEAEIDVPGITKKLGALKNAGNDLTNTFKIKGVAAMWGDMHSPGQITREDAVPVIFFQGEQDRVNPFDEGHVYFCPNFMYVYGTKPLYNRLKGLGVSTVAHVDPNGGHGVFSDDFRMANVNCFFKEVMLNKHVEGYYVGEETNCK